MVKALERAGKKAKLLFSWDEFDRLRKVPKNVAAVRDDFEQYIGYPYVDVPDPFDSGAKSYAAYFENEFIASMEKIGIKLDYRHQAEMYRSGAYREQILLALRKRGEIFDMSGSLLVGNRPCVKLSCSPYEIKDPNKRRRLAAILASISPEQKPSRGLCHASAST